MPPVAAPVAAADTCEDQMQQLTDRIARLETLLTALQPVPAKKPWNMLDAYEEAEARNPTYRAPPQPFFDIEVKLSDATTKACQLRPGVIAKEDVNMECEKCQSTGNDLMIIPSPSNHYCKHCEEFDEYTCRECWYTTKLEIPVLQVCSSCKHKYSTDETAPEPGYHFKRTEDWCQGHWYKTECCTAICYDCKESECSCYGFYHCCCVNPNMNKTDPQSSDNDSSSGSSSSSSSL
jgi:hypothetical protein